MRRHMFGDVVDPSVKVGTRQWYTVPLSIVTHVAVIGALVIVPLLATDMIPTPQSVMAFVAVPPPPPPPPPPPAPSTAPQPTVQVNPNAAPIEAPPDIVFNPPPPPPPPSFSMAGAVGGVAGGVPGGTPGGVVGGIPPPPEPTPPVPIRPGGDIREPSKIRDVKPVYPQIAQSAKVEGIVIVEAIIAKDGTVRDAKILRSVALLDQAALDAVRQWRYTPTLLNGVPVEVIVTVTVRFTIR